VDVTSVVSDVALESARLPNVSQVGGNRDLWMQHRVELATILKPNIYVHAAVAANSNVAIRSIGARSSATKVPVVPAGKLSSMNSAATVGVPCCSLHFLVVLSHLRVASHASVPKTVAILKWHIVATEMRRAVQNAHF
jgi:hypothetical protein